MNQNATRGQETDGPTDTTEQRAEWEAFEFRVPAPGRVRVENASYGDESGEHVYVVEVAENVGATACTCPSDEYRSEACKHRRAVENAEPVMLAATDGLSGAYPIADDGADAAIATDGGTMADKIDGGDEESSDAGDTDDDPRTCSECGETFDSFLEFARHDRGDECDDTPDTESEGREEPTRSEPADFGGGDGGIDEL